MRERGPKSLDRRRRGRRRLGSKSSIKVNPIPSPFTPPVFSQNLTGSEVTATEWGRLPRAKQRCPISSLSRSTLADLGKRGLITMKRLVKPGRKRGCVLVNLASLKAFIEQLPNE